MGHFLGGVSPASRKRAISLGLTGAEFDVIFRARTAAGGAFEQSGAITAFLDRLAATNNQQERDRLILAGGGNDPAFAARAAGVAARKEVVRIGRRRGFTSTIRGGAGGRGANSFLQPLGGQVSPESRQFLGG